MISPARITAKPFPPCYGLPENEAVGAGDFTGVRYLASSAFVPTNARNRHPALPPDVCFSACWGSTPNPLNSPVAGAGCAFGSRTLWKIATRQTREAAFLDRIQFAQNRAPVCVKTFSNAMSTFLRFLSVVIWREAKIFSHHPIKTLSKCPL